MRGRRAAQIKPADARMWVAMAQCYTHEHLAMDAMGVRCYQRAIQNGDKEFVALPNLAKLYAKMGLEDQAVRVTTATEQLRIATGATGLARRDREWVLERGTNPKQLRRARTCEYGLQWRGNSAGVAKRPRERSISHPKSLTLRFATFGSLYVPSPFSKLAPG